MIAQKAFIKYLFQLEVEPELKLFAYEQSFAVLADNHLGKMHTYERTGEMESKLGTWRISNTN